MLWQRGIAAGVLAIVAALAACRRSSPPPLPPPQAEPDRFPHPAHAQLACTPCHDQAAIVAGSVRPPGADDHAACDNAACHGTAFAQPPSALCKVCHTSVDPTGVTPSPLRIYPAIDGVRALPSRFSHARHLDDAAMERAVGFHIACADCHEVDREGRPGAASHGACARCHAAEVGLPDAPTMAACDACHTAGTAARVPRQLIVRDLTFDHAPHRADARGAAIGCATCHTRSRAAESSLGHTAPPIAACVECHDDSSRVPGTKRMRICETCHTAIALTFGAIAPRSHLPATELPADHTLAFRRDHALDAADATRCSRCHTQMSGSADNACDECHSVLRPRDHNLVWREVDHGTEAIADRDRCAACHVVDYCSACHRQRPRSHGPGRSFGDADHGDLARQNPAACLTCHIVENDCTTCHLGGM